MNEIQKNTNVNTKKETRRLRKSKRGTMIRRCSLLFLLVLVCFFCIGAIKTNLAPAIVTITVQDAEIKQEEEMPEFHISVATEGNVDKKLDVEEGYSVHSLLADLEAGYGYHIASDVVVQEEGVYKLSITLNDEIQDKLNGDWAKKLIINLVDGEIQVRNKWGRWEESVFMSWEDVPVTNQWIQSHGQTYYLDDNGTFTTGEMQISLTKYVFDDGGRLLSQEPYIDPNKPMIALTFDDGPRGDTDRLLDALKKYDAHATFYILGNSLREEYRGTLQRMVELGCELGNHSKSHQAFTSLTPYEMQLEVNTTSEWIADYAGVYPSSVRLPYGAINKTVQNTIEMPLIFWSVDTLDWKTKDKDATVRAILEQSQDGSIVLLHDIHSWSVDAAIEAIPVLQEQGYQLVTVSEMAQARGVELVNGERYGSFYP